MILALAGVFISTRFPITPSNHAVLRREIDRLRGGGSLADVDPETKRICEKLSGHPYETLYRIGEI